jgi:hypothetical protein
MSSSMLLSSDVSALFVPAMMADLALSPLEIIGFLRRAIEQQCRGKRRRRHIKSF